jgi:hypothetical protein
VGYSSDEDVENDLGEFRAVGPGPQEVQCQRIPGVLAQHLPDPSDRIEERARRPFGEKLPEDVSLPDKQILHFAL